MSKARYSKKKSKNATHSPIVQQNPEIPVENVSLGANTEKQKARKFNTEHIIFLNIPKFEISSRTAPKKENFSEKELNSLQTSLETLSTNLSTTLKKLQAEIDHILELQAEDDSNIVQEDDYNLNPEKYSADNTHFSSEGEEEEETVKPDEVITPINSPTFTTVKESPEISPERNTTLDSEGSSHTGRKKNDTPETPVLRKGKSRSKAKGTKNRQSVTKSERKKKKKIYDAPLDDLPTHIPTNFWPHISPFISPISIVDMEFLNEKSENLTKEQLSLPPLGKGHPIDFDTKDDKKRVKGEKEPKSSTNAFYTSRLLAALIEDPNQNNNSFDQYQSFYSSISSNSNSDPENLEDKIISELRNIGVLDENSSTTIDPSERKDDEICEEIRATQRQLVELIKLNNQRKIAFMNLASDKMKEQFLDRQLKIKSSHIEKLFSRRMQRNKKRRTKGRAKGGRASQTQTSPTRPIPAQLPGKKPHSVFNNHVPENNPNDTNNVANNNSNNPTFGVSNYFESNQNVMEISPKMEYMDDMDTVPPPPEDDMDYDH